MIFLRSSAKSSSRKLLFEKHISFASWPISLKLYPSAAAYYGVTTVFIKAKRSFLSLFCMTREGFGTVFYLWQARTKSLVTSVRFYSLFGLKTSFTSFCKKLCFMVLYIRDSMYLALSLITAFCCWLISFYSLRSASYSLSTSSLISLLTDAIDYSFWSLKLAMLFLGVLPNGGEPETEA